jgi:hypothetical protein
VSARAVGRRGDVHAGTDNAAAGSTGAATGDLSTKGGAGREGCHVVIVGAAVRSTTKALGSLGKVKVTALGIHGAPVR